MFIVYRQSIVSESRGLPLKNKNIHDFVQHAIFFNQMATEEKLMNDVIAESKKLIEARNYEEAAKTLKDALTHDKWKDLYGTTILSNLVYSLAMQGNIQMASHYLS